MRRRDAEAQSGSNDKGFGYWSAHACAPALVFGNGMASTDIMNAGTAA
jgi:hypothetical protein